MNHDELSGVKVKDDEKYSSDDVMTFHNLVTHDNFQSDAPSLMVQAQVALFFLRCLQFKGYLKRSNNPESLNEEESFFVMLIHHFIHFCFMHTHDEIS